MGVTGFDHVALPTANAERFLAFYQRLGFRIEGEDEWRAGIQPHFAIAFGDNKINVHPEAMVAMRGQPFYLRAPAAEPGCGDLCFVWDGGLERLREHLLNVDVDILEGPVARAGARSGGVSVYIRDPDDNLLEFISYRREDIERYPHRPQR